MERRFIHGPERPHVDKSIQELLQVLDQNYIAARKLDPESGRVMKVVEDIVTDTFLRPGVSEAQIRELEKRLAQNLSLDAEDDKPMLPNGKNGKLPEDYKEFLRISNGYFPEGNPLSGLFYSYDEVGTADCAFLSEDSMDLGFSLFPYVYTSIRGIDNIQLGHFDCFAIGIGGDEGTVILIPPMSVKLAVEAFEAAYASANKENK
ncbi:SMI1-KNR4 domain containing protein [Pyrenophora teres f. teres]|uniref:SMI1-KNR4 domain containing protein n=1 Tax=Pyrenophora teres f. teres TaxID=97479 RepID=A0A6S6WA43_9PLEO|nr:SMI1-KNR4 domain containing protein [Pyrenophora teres f. teres]